MLKSFAGTRAVSPSPRRPEVRVMTPSPTLREFEERGNLETRPRDVAAGKVAWKRYRLAVG
jgi:hypothetical protein